MEFDQYGIICQFNKECRCQVADCDYCGWNPEVSERRLVALLQKKQEDAMAKNDLMKRMQEREQAALDVGEEMGIQKMWDYLQLALRDDRVVRGKRFGKNKLKELYKVMAEYANYFHDCFTMHPEADVRQEELDKMLAEIWETELQPFKERYPYCKEFSYKKSRKEWK